MMIVRADLGLPPLKLKCHLVHMAAVCVYGFQEKQTSLERNWPQFTAVSHVLGP